MDCPHLVQSYEAFFVDDAVSIIMEFLDCSLHQLLASLPNCRLPPPALQWTLFQVWGPGGGGNGNQPFCGLGPVLFFFILPIHGLPYDLQLDIKPKML